MHTSAPRSLKNRSISSSAAGVALQTTPARTSASLVRQRHRTPQSLPHTSSRPSALRKKPLPRRRKLCTGETLRTLQPLCQFQIRKDHRAPDPTRHKRRTRRCPFPPQPARRRATLEKLICARLILASASPRRRELLTQAGYTFEVQPAHIHEDPATRRRPHRLRRPPRPRKGGGRLRGDFVQESSPTAGGRARRRHHRHARWPHPRQA